MIEMPKFKKDILRYSNTVQKYVPFMLVFKVGHSLELNQRFLTFFDRWKNLCQRRGDVDEVAKLIVSVIIHSFSINGES